MKHKIRKRKCASAAVIGRRGAGDGERKHLYSQRTCVLYKLGTLCKQARYFLFVCLFVLFFKPKCVNEGICSLKSCQICATLLPPCLK